MRKKTKEINGVIIESHKYYDNDFQRIMKNINKKISDFRIIYGTNPQFIVISRELAILFDVELRLMEQKQCIMFNNQYLEFYSVWGIPCIVSKALDKLGFEVR